MFYIFLRRCPLCNHEFMAHGSAIYCLSFQSDLRDQPSFRASAFERFVDSIGSAASGHLHSLVLERADLREELTTARNWQGIERGD